jgi:hypothetical protein
VIRKSWSQWLRMPRSSQRRTGEPRCGSRPCLGVLEGAFRLPRFRHRFRLAFVPTQLGIEAELRALAEAAPAKSRRAPAVRALLDRNYVAAADAFFRDGTASARRTCPAARGRAAPHKRSARGAGRATQARSRALPIRLRVAVRAPRGGLACSHRVTGRRSVIGRSGRLGSADGSADHCRQALAWRMRRQLLDPVGNLPFARVVGRLCGVQAQMRSSAELAVRVRRQHRDLARPAAPCPRVAYPEPQTRTSCRLRGGVPSVDRAAGSCLSS